VAQEDADDDDNRSQSKPAKMWFRASKLKGFPAALIKGAYQDENSTKDNHHTHNDVREVLKRSGVFCLFMGV
jgi:hypothetical protein